MLTSRLATRADLPLLAPIVDATIGELQKDFLTPEQIASSRAIMGIDTQLVDDGTYFVVLSDDVIAGCGSVLRRAERWHAVCISPAGTLCTPHRFTPRRKRSPGLNGL
jgi:hypothetical protein